MGIKIISRRNIDREIVTFVMEVTGLSTDWTRPHGRLTRDGRLICIRRLGSNESRAYEYAVKENLQEIDVDKVPDDFPPKASREPTLRGRFNSLFAAPPMYCDFGHSS